MSRSRFAASIRSNRWFLLVLSGGVILRILVIIAYRPILLLQRDSYAYLTMAVDSSPGGFRPALYPLMLRPLIAFHDLTVVAVLQHVLGLTVAILIYLLLRRVEITPGLAAAGAAFVLLDPYQVDIEHYVLAEALFQLLVTVAAFLLLWRARPQTWVVGVAGVLLAMATLARFAGALLGVAAIVYLIMRRQGLRAVAALVVGLLLPVAVYSVWFSSSSGSVGITNKEGYFLYGRVFTFADCDRVDVAQDLEKYCPTQPLNTRESGGFFSIREGLSGGESSETNRDLSAFARAVISQQPLDYVSAVASDFLRFFDISQPKDRERHARRWLFVESVEEVDPHPLVERLRGSPPPELGSEQEFQIDRGLAGALRTYQSVVYVYGPLLAVWLLLGVAGALWGRDPRARSATVLFSLGSLLLLWFPVMVTVYHFRYVIAALPTSGAAGAAGVSLLRARWRHRRSASTATALARERSSEVRQKSTNDIP